MNEANIPSRLRNTPRWVGWGHYHQKKVPIDCKTGRYAKVNDPLTWSAFQDAVAFARAHAVAGMGFVFTDEDDIMGIDLDQCRDPETGAIEPWAERIVSEVASYAEISPSGTGIKIFVGGRLPGGSNWRQQGVELYGQKRFFTVTGLHLPGTPCQVEARHEEIASLCQRLFPESGSGVSEETRTFSLAEKSNQGIIEHINGLPYGAKLWAGDTRKYSSASEADLALCGLLASLIGPDVQRIEALFGQSGLAARKKWKQREDYRKQTVAKAVEGLGRYQPKKSMLTMTIQDHSGYTHGHAASRDSTTEHNPSLDKVSLSLDDLDTFPADRLAFAVARRLHRVQREHPEQFRPVIDAFCKKAGVEFRDLWIDFLECWPFVKYPEGESNFAWAAHMARKNPLDCCPELGEDINLLCSLAYYLAVRCGDKPFFLPVEKVGPWLNMSAMKGSRIIKVLIRNNFIKPVDGTYSYTKKKAKEFVYVGPRPATDGTLTAVAWPSELAEEIV